VVPCSLVTHVCAAHLFMVVSRKKKRKGNMQKVKKKISKKSFAQFWPANMSESVWQSLSSSAHCSSRSCGCHHWEAQSTSPSDSSPKTTQKGIAVASRFFLLVLISQLPLWKIASLMTSGHDSTVFLVCRQRERERGLYTFSQPTRLYRCARVLSNLVKHQY